MFCTVGIICKLVLTKLGFKNNHLVLLISNSVLFSNMLKGIQFIILYKTQLK